MKESFDRAAGQERGGAAAASREEMRAVMEHQKALAEELYRRDHPSAAVAEHDHDFREAVMGHWIGNQYAEAFRNLMRRRHFSEHPRLNGDPLGVTLSDVEYFLHNQELPER